MLTSREVQTMLKSLGITELEPTDPDHILKPSIYGYLRAEVLTN